MSSPVTWVVSAYERAVIDALRALGIPVVPTLVTPFSDQVAFEGGEPMHRRVIPFGTNTLLRWAIKRGWLGMFGDPERFSMRQAFQNRRGMLNSGAMIGTVREMTAYLRYYATGERYHVRPDSDLKSFSGMVMDRVELIGWLEKSPNGYLGPDILTQNTLVCVSPERALIAEIRCFVVDGRLIDWCFYKRRGERVAWRIGPPNELVDLCLGVVVGGWLPHPTCVVDVAATADGTMEVVEFNCLNGTGFYHHDLPTILHTVTRHVEGLAEQQGEHPCP